VELGYKVQEFFPKTDKTENEATNSARTIKTIAILACSLCCMCILSLIAAVLVNRILVSRSTEQSFEQTDSANYETPDAGNKHLETNSASEIAAQPAATVIDAWNELEIMLQHRFNDENIAVFALDLRSPERILAVNADKPMYIASIYKLAVAYAALRLVDMGQLSMDTKLNGSQSVRYCLEQMLFLVKTIVRTRLDFI